MSGLPDFLQEGLGAVICGTAVGNRSAAIGHYYAGRGNEFWELLWSAGLTAELLGPERDREILRFGLGLTDLAKGRTSSSDRDLTSSDYDVAAFVDKMERYRPGWVAFHGKTAANIARRELTGEPAAVTIGRQQWRIGDIRVFVLPSASAANRDPGRLEGKPFRLAWFQEFRRYIDRL